MTIKEPQISLFDMIMCLSDAVDLVSPAVANHHKQVAYIAFSIGAEMGLTMEQQSELVLAGALHDIGALSAKERIDLLRFDVLDPRKHAELGYLFLKKFQPLASVANIVRFHHIPWNGGSGSEFKGQQVSIYSHILHLADRVAVLINKQQEVLGQVKMISKKIEDQSGKRFMPQLVDAFKSLAAKEYVWLDLASSKIGSILRHSVLTASVELNMESLLGFVDIFRGIIDFRSRFTTTHSSGVAASSESLARLSGFSERECLMMKVAGYLHDLGKLAVPAEILEKPAKLSEEEINIIRSHTFYTYRTLESINGLEIINAWGAFHHERLDGSGYPFHLNSRDLSLGSRIMAVSDVFTAITEDRPYRKGMSSSKALQIILQMAGKKKLDPYTVLTLRQYFDEINHFRKAAQEASVADYQHFLHQSD